MRVFDFRDQLIAGRLEAQGAAESSETRRRPRLLLEKRNAGQPERTLGRPYHQAASSRTRLEALVRARVADVSAAHVPNGPDLSPRMTGGR